MMKDLMLLLKNYFTSYNSNIVIPLMISFSGRTTKINYLA
jgi:hypothetical protein